MVFIVLTLLVIIFSYVRQVTAISFKIRSRSICCHGYTGHACGQDINECLVNNGKSHQICQNSFGSYQCYCRNGFSLESNDKTCLDINECLESNGGCSHICENSLGSYQCNCKNGFYLASDGRTCIDINECSKNNGECNQYCKNLDGSYTCSCKDGFNLAKNGKTCEDINECLDTTCLNNGSCVNIEGSYSCQCKQGFAGDVCQADINECLHFNNTCDDQCINTNGSFYCKCNGYGSSLSDDGVSCRVYVKDKSYNSMAVGLGTSISLAFVVVVILLVVILKMRHKKLSTPNDTQPTSQIYQSTQIGSSGVRTIYNNLYGNYENVLKPEYSENNRSMNEYESVVVKEDSEIGGLSPHDNIQITGIIDDSGQHRPDRETAEYENLVIFRK